MTINYDPKRMVRIHGSLPKSVGRKNESFRVSKDSKNNIEGDKNVQ